jgi:hypothetical protein
MRQERIHRFVGSGPRVGGQPMDDHFPQQRYVRLLMNRVLQDEHPSSSDLNRIEQSISTGEEAAEYLEYLFQRVEQTRRPSSEILNRIERIVG